MGSFWTLTAYGAVLLLIQLLRNLQILCLFIVLSVGAVFFPPLTIVLVGVIIYLIVTRLSYIAQHWVLMAAGFGLYGLGYVADQVMVHVLYDIARISAPLLGVSFTLWAVPVVLVGLGAHLLHRALWVAYRAGYRPFDVLTITLTAPAIIILLLLSIFGIGGDFVPDVAPEVAPDLGPDVAPRGAVNGVVEPAAAGSLRGTTTPELVEVRGYIRSNPDGIVENNLSYKGPRPLGTPEAPGLHQVQGHVRTAPDGIVENNLSYRGPTTAQTSAPTPIEVQPSSSEPGPPNPAGTLSAADSRKKQRDS